MLNNRALSLIIIALVVMAITAHHSQAQQSGATGKDQLQAAERPSVTIENLQGAPMSLRLVSVRPMPDRPKMVKIILQVEGKDTALIKSYSVRYEETWKDKGSGDGTLTSDRTSSNQPPHEISFIARQNGKITLWVSSVVFANGSEWKSGLRPIKKKE